MSLTDLAVVQEQIQKYWAPRYSKQLRASLLLGSLVNKDYKGEIKKGGDEVTVSQIQAATGEIRTVGVDADSFNSESAQMLEVKVKADKRAIASFEFADLVSLQSQLDQEDPQVLEALNYGMESQINNYLYSLMVPSTSSPDHDISGVTDFNASQLAACRTLAAKAKWMKMPGWYALLDPQYYGDILNAVTLTSSEYGATDAPVIGGQVALKRFGFNIFEDNSRGDDQGFLFHPDTIHLVQQTEVQIKISDLHSQKKFGVLMSVDLIFGAKQGIEGNKKVIKVYNS
jgi:hypothetical protein